ncbi:hypothetical protein ACF0H5_023603 [Mactra antiquata]
MSDTQRKGATVMVCSFLYGSFWATGPLLGWSNYKEEDIGIACCVTWEVNNSSALSYTISLCTIGWLLPLTLIAYGYISIALSIRKEQAKRQYMHSVSSLNKNKRRERKVAITVLIMIGAFVISWMPYSVVSLWSAFGDFHNIPLGVQVAPAIFAKCSIIWNPMIYVARHKHFRRGVKHSVPCLYMLSRSKSQVSETRQLEQATNAQRQGSSVRENSQNKHSDCFRSSSYSSETPSMNKESIACSNHGTYSVWVETPTSLQHGKETNFFPHKNFRQSTDTDVACCEGLISESNHFITLGTQTDSSYLATVQINHRLKSELIGESKDVADKSDIDAQKITALEHNEKKMQESWHYHHLLRLNFVIHFRLSCINNLLCILFSKGFLGSVLRVERKSCDTMTLSVRRHNHPMNNKIVYDKTYHIRSSFELDTSRASETEITLLGKLNECLLHGILKSKITSAPYTSYEILAHLALIHRV